MSAVLLQARVFWRALDQSAAETLKSSFSLSSAKSEGVFGLAESLGVMRSSKTGLELNCSSRLPLYPQQAYSALWGLLRPPRLSLRQRCVTSGQRRPFSVSCSYSTRPGDPSSQSVGMTSSSHSRTWRQSWKPASAKTASPDEIAMLQAQQRRFASNVQTVQRSPSNLHIPPAAPGPSYRSPHLRHQPLPPVTQLPLQTGARPAVVQGVVKTITLQNDQTGFVVAKIKVAAGEVESDKMHRKGVVTAVGVHKQLLMGQQVRLEGHWIKHKKYGFQLEVQHVAALQMSEKDTVMAMLQGANLPGVGPVTAARLAAHFGAELQAVMDRPDADRKLCAVSGIGAKTAMKIKTAWDGSKSRREAAAFLQEVGLGGKVLQRIVARHGESTKEEVSKDPYYALRNIKGMNLRLAEAVAQRLAADHQVPSRAAMAMSDVLQEAARDCGHTFLTWEELQKQSLRHLNSSGLFWKGSNLVGIAEKAAAWGDIVTELGDIKPDAGSATPAEDKLKAVEVSLRSYLSNRIPKVGPMRSQQLVDRFGSSVIGVLESTSAEAQLKAVLPLKNAAAEIKQNWDNNPRKKLAWTSPFPDIELPPSSQRAQLARQQQVELGEAPSQWLPSVRCYHPELHAAEVTVARELARLVARRQAQNRNNSKVDRWIANNERETGHVLSEGQKAAVRAASTAPIMILTGGPGCGKTHTTATIVKLWSAMRKDVKLAAPTGRASQRLQEMAGMPSSTIHRLLQYKAAGARQMEAADDEEELEGSYNFNRSNPLPADAVLVDEAAMLDLNLCAALLEALPRHCQLVLVGDVDQLPPVGPGTVLSAAIQSGVVPVIDLREIFRQAETSAIVTAAHAVQRGEFPPLDLLHPRQLEAQYQGPVLGDAVWVKPEGTDGKALQDLVLKSLQNYIQPLGFNPLTDVQVLSPMRSGAAGVELMNQQLQKLLNPAAEEIPEIPIRPRGGSGVLRLSDRVIQTINNYEREVFNGDPGRIIAVHPADRSMTVEFQETDFARIMEGHKVKKVEYKASGLWELDMAWATTVHKSQGGESPVVVLLLSNSHRRLLTRRLLYTALTRAKNLVVVVGHEKAIQTAVAEVLGDMRLSSLQPRLKAQAEHLGVNSTESLQFGAAHESKAVEVPVTDPSAAVPAIVTASISAASAPPAATPARAPLLQGTELQAGIGAETGAELGAGQAADAVHSRKAESPTVRKQVVARQRAVPPRIAPKRIPHAPATARYQRGASQPQPKPPPPPVPPLQTAGGSPQAPLSRGQRWGSHSPPGPPAEASPAGSSPHYKSYDMTQWERERPPSPPGEYCKGLRFLSPAPSQGFHPEAIQEALTEIFVGSR